MTPDKYSVNHKFLTFSVSSIARFRGELTPPAEKTARCHLRPEYGQTGYCQIIFYAK